MSSAWLESQRGFPAGGPPSLVTQDFVFVKQGEDRRDQEGHCLSDRWHRRNDL